MLAYRKPLSVRLLRMPRFRSRSERIWSYAAVIWFTRGMMLVTLFLTIDLHSPCFFVGGGLYLLAMGFYLSAMKTFADTPACKPVTSGVFKRTRHPLQFFSLVMWVGVGVATGSLFLLAACLCHLLLSLRFIRLQERDCLEIYGASYRVYLESTPLFLFTKQHFMPACIKRNL